MEKTVDTIADADQRTPQPAGYTYFGQFVDHDLTLDETPLREALRFASIPAQTTNATDARLNLNHLYGDGPRSVRHGHLYAADGASFRLRSTRSPTGKLLDLPIGEYGPESAEGRNVENLILRQLCAMFLELHNRAVQELPATLPSSERFQRARNRVCWQYQYLVREDYLPRITAANVYRRVVREGRAKIDWLRKGFSIPVEFSQAAFRFGHSMVRTHYDLNPGSRDVPLRRIFAGPQRFEAVEPEMAVDWSAFLGAGKPLATIPAAVIDMTIAGPLFHLPSERVHHLTDLEAPPLPPQLPVRTLQRGASTRLASGEQVARALGHRTLREKAVNRGVKVWARLDELGLKDRTPLWYYILQEAQIEGSGLCLGTVGSELVTEVIDGCLKTDPTSYISCFGSSWTPPAWRSSAGETIKIDRLQDVAIVTGLIPAGVST